MGGSFYISFSFVLAAAASLSCWAGPSRHVYVPDDLMGPHREKCMQLLEEGILGNLAPSTKPLSMTIGNLRSFGKLLVRSGAPAYAVREAVRWLDEQLDLPQTHPVWSKTVEEIRRQKASPTLFACVLGKNCKFLGNAGFPDDGGVFRGETKAMHAALEHFQVARFPELRPPRVPLSERRRPEFIADVGALSGIQVIMLKFPEVDSQPDWMVRLERGLFLSDLAHEVTHAADWEVFSLWILANYILIEQRRFDDVDSLFDSLTREHPDGTLLVDEGFVSTYLESRAYSVTDWIENNHPDVVAAGAISKRPDLLPNQVAILAIKQNGGGWFLDRNKIDEENIFEFGVKLGRRFEKVIRAAGISPP